MSKIIDITDKLSFDEKPSIKIKDTVLKVNNDTPTMFKVMAILEDGAGKSAEIKRLVSLLFDFEECEKLDALKLAFPDYSKVIMNTAKIAVNGFDEAEGEEATPATT